MPKGIEQPPDKGYKATRRFNPAWKEYDKIKGIRPDYIDFDKKIIYELKPNNLTQYAKVLNNFSNTTRRLAEDSH